MLLGIGLVAVDRNRTVSVAELVLEGMVGPQFYFLLGK